MGSISYYLAGDEITMGDINEAEKYLKLKGPFQFEWGIFVKLIKSKLALRLNGVRNFAP